MREMSLTVTWEEHVGGRMAMQEMARWAWARGVQDEDQAIAQHRRWKCRG